MAHEKDESILNPDDLRTPEHLCDPDPRIRHLVKVDQDSGLAPALTRADQYGSIAKYALSGTVPGDVRILFDTARNLYLYAWFVYHFYNVAEQQVFACLEMALT